MHFLGGCRCGWHSCGCLTLLILARRSGTHQGFQAMLVSCVFIERSLGCFYQIHFGFVCVGVGHLVDQLLMVKIRQTCCPARDSPQEVTFKVRILVFRTQAHP